jgi:phosphoribosylformimino-5-aminoimidazole carboxamide ribonucleotide (ProFAR) isomerase
MPSEQPSQERIFVCRFVPSHGECVRLVQLVEAQDAEAALRKFATSLSSESAGWIDILDQNGALVQTRFHLR